MFYRQKGTHFQQQYMVIDLALRQTYSRNIGPPLVAYIPLESGKLTNIRF